MDIKVKIRPKEWAEKRFQMIKFWHEPILTDMDLQNIDAFISACGFILDEETEQPKPICTTHNPDANGICLVCGELIYALLSEEPKPTEQPEPTPQRSEKWLACEKYLKQLPDGYRERALSQMDEKTIESVYISESIDYAVGCFCYWDNTNEGSYFWLQVQRCYDFEQKPTKLPPLPND